MHTSLHLYPKDIPKIIHKFRQFIGYRNYAKGIKHYKKAIASSTPIYQEYLKNKLSLWKTISDYEDNRHKWSSNNKPRVTDEMTISLSTPLYLRNIHKTMPIELRNLYKATLSDPNNASGYRHEIHIAHHFFLNGFNINWHTGNKKKAEFTITRFGEHPIDVECKEFSLEKHRKIQKKDFYSFSDTLISKLHKNNTHGDFDITLNDRLSSNILDHNKVADEILSVSYNNNYFDGKTNFGHLTCLLCENNNHPSNISLFPDAFIKTCSIDTDGLAFSFDNINMKNITTITIRSRKHADAMSSLYSIIKKACTSQLNERRIGYLSIKIPDLNDLLQLKNDNVFHPLIEKLFSSDKYKHISCISFCTNMTPQTIYGEKNFIYNTLSFTNLQCKHQLPPAFPS